MSTQPAAPASLGSRHPSPRQLPLRTLPLLLVTGLLPACSTPSSPSSSSSAPTGPFSQARSIDHLIAQHADSVRTREFPTTRIRTEGDLNQDGLVDTVVIYRLEGDPAQDGFEQYLTAAVSAGSRSVPPVLAPVRVGAQGGSSISSARIRMGTLELNTLEYLPSDASCCPTGRGTQFWTWHARQGLQPLSRPQPPTQPSTLQEVTK